MDDLFDSTSLDSKWTVTEGASGTVDLLATSKAATYDLSSIPGYLACQVENNKIHLRQDYALPSGKSVILKFHPAINASSNDANELRVSLVLNCSDTSPLTTTTSGFMLIEFNATTDGWRVFAECHNSSGTQIESTAVGEEGDESTMNGGTIYLRIARSNTKYYWYTSFDGHAWIPMKSGATPTATFSNVWIRVRSDVDTASKVLPVQLIDWIKEVDNTQWVVS